jgi:hypothetical protein
MGPVPGGSSSISLFLMQNAKRAQINLANRHIQFGLQIKEIWWNPLIEAAIGESYFMVSCLERGRHDFSYLASVNSTRNTLPAAEKLSTALWLTCSISTTPLHK